MNDFPEFMKHPLNKIPTASQHTEEIEGYVFDGADGSQVAFWKCCTQRVSQEHTHDYDEYLAVLQGQYTLIIDQQRISLGVGQEYFIPKEIAHAGEGLAGTRTVHCFGGKRIPREKQD